MTEPTLYLYPAEDDLPSFSPPCAKVALVLAYCGLPHKIRPVRGDPAKHSPTGRLPALALGAELLSDSVLILDRLEALEPPQPFWPSEPAARARDRVWEHFVNDTLYWVGLYERWFVPENRRRLLDHLFGAGVFSFKRRVVAPIVCRDVRRRAAGHGIGLESPAEARAAFTRGLAVTEPALEAGPFLGGRDRPGRGDFALAAWIAQAGYRGLTPWADAQVRAHPRTVEHARRVFDVCKLPVPGALEP